MMVDYHQGLIDLADAALARNPSEHIRTDARTMRQKRASEQKEMIAMLKSDYGEDKMPMVMPSNAQMISDVASKSGTDLETAGAKDRVVAHPHHSCRGGVPWTMGDALGFAGVQGGAVGVTGKRDCLKQIKAARGQRVARQWRWCVLTRFTVDKNARRVYGCRATLNRVLFS